MITKFPVYQPSLNGNEKKYVIECLDTTWISSKGKFINIFEEKFAAYIGVKYAIGVCNGTVALHLAMLALGIGEDDEVIVPTLTYIASVNAIKYVGATPVFCDSDKDSWQIDPKEIRKKITKKTKAILVVHLYGHPCEMSEINQICKENNIFLVEDCAESIASKYKDVNVGTFADISTFSFFGNKTITTGEGGMVLTNSETLRDRINNYKGQGLAKHRQYWHDIVGYNYRMTNICAAIGLAQLEQIDSILEKKIQISKWYKTFLKNTSFEIHAENENVVHTYWMVSILVPNPENRESIRLFLQEKGVETRPLFYPVHTMPMYSGKYQSFPIAENLGWRGINLPSYPDLTEENVKEICDILIESQSKFS